MLITFFVLILVAGLGTLIAGIKWKHWLLTLIATVLFSVLALQAFKIEVVSGGVTLVFQEVVIVLLCWVLTFVGAIFTLVGMISFASKYREEHFKKSGR